ncbi:MAG: deoxyribonuclease II family protein, partial [Bacteroidota bacterium]
MISARQNETGKAIDWWLCYKFPQNIGPKNNSTGFEFLYVDSEDQDGFRLSPVALNDMHNCIERTLDPFFNGARDTGYIIWNDLQPRNEEGTSPV